VSHTDVQRLPVPVYFQNAFSDLADGRIQLSLLRRTSVTVWLKGCNDECNARTPGGHM